MQRNVRKYSYKSQGNTRIMILSLIKFSLNKLYLNICRIFFMREITDIVMTQLIIKIKKIELLRRIGLKSSF